VFEKPSGGWADATESARLSTSDLPPNGNFLGEYVAVAHDAVAVAAPVSPEYVFVKPSTGWADATQQTAKLPGGGAVAADGDTIVSACGDVCVYVKPLSGWTNMSPTATLTASQGGEAGGQVAISGETVAAGGCGGVCVWKEPPGAWADETETAGLAAADGAPSDQFGYSLATSADTVVVGAPFATVDGNQGQGAVYVFGPGSPPATAERTRGLCWCAARSTREFVHRSCRWIPCDLHGCGRTRGDSRRLHRGR
jgi:hypothetical protein